MSFWQLGRARRLLPEASHKGQGRFRKAPARRRAALNLEPLEQRLLFAIAPTLVSVITNIPNDGDVLSPTTTTSLQQAPQQLIFKFDDGQIINPSTLATGIQIVRAGGDHTVPIGYEGVPEQSNQVVVRFQDTLPDDTYTITVTSALKNTSGQGLSTGTATRTFKLDYGAQVSAVVPQPITRDAQGLHQNSNQIQVYFTNDTLSTASAQDPTLYQLIATSGTANTNDDVIKNPTSVVYDPVKNMATLTFASNLDALGTGIGFYRLRIGNSGTGSTTQTVPVAVDQAGSSFATSLSLGALSTQTKLITGAAITAPGSTSNNPAYDIVYPGAPSDPGQRDIPAESHLLGGPDFDPGIATYFYNFQSVYGTDPQGHTLYNQITPQQMQDVRDIFTLYGHYLGVQFVESPNQGLIIATGDPRALDPSAPVTSLGGIAGGGVAVMNNFVNWGTSEFGGGYFQTAMHEIGHLLGLGHSYELPGLQIMGSSGGSAESGQTNSAEPVFPGSFDILDAQYLYRPESKDINVYNFTLSTAGTLSAETIAQRAPVNSLLNSVLTLYDASGKMLARNDDYFGGDSFLNLPLSAGQYYIAVTSTGNTNFNPNVADSGAGGTTDGAYNLRLSFSPIPPSKQLLDVGGQALDGDLDGVSGGTFNFWFQVGNASNTIFVDKAAAAGGTGTISSPYNNIAVALSVAAAGDIVRIVGNGGADGNLATLGDDKAYEIGIDQFGNALSDGATMNVPQGVTVMIDAGAIFKLRGANINAGSFTLGLDNSGGAIQVLGTPQQSAYFTSYNNRTIGVPLNSLNVAAAPGDWGGLVYQADSDYEANGIFLNYVAHADISNGGGAVNVAGTQQVYNAVHLVTSRPTVLDNKLHDNADAAISADPDSFQYSLIEGFTAGQAFTADYSRAGPLVHGNVLSKNSINGLFIRIRTDAGAPIDVLDVTARLTSTDIVYVLTENLEIQSRAGGAVTDDNGNITQRVSAAGDVGALIIDPGVIIKAAGSRIEVGVGGNLIAEGTSAKPIIFTSLLDTTFGAGGVFDTTGSGGASTPLPGDWSGFFFNPVSNGSIDHAVIMFGGGTSPIEGGFANFNAVEIYQATVRIADSVLERNAEGFDSSNRNGRSATGAAAIYVIGAQPAIINNIIRRNAGDAISINANSLTTRSVPDWGRSTGNLGRFTQFDDNFGPLVRLNILDGNDTNGMEVRGAVLDTQSVWDDTDVVHVLRANIDIPNFESVGGLQLKSSVTQSLVVKLNGPAAGFTADGTPLDISNRIGGALQVLGTPGHAVVLTALADSTVGAGYDLLGNPQVNTLGNGLTVVTTASQLKINFNFGPGIIGNTEAIAALELAAEQWEAVLDDPITINVDIDFTTFSDAGGAIGLTNSVISLLDYDDVRKHLIANQQANDSFITGLPTFAQLQTTTLPGTIVPNKLAVPRADALALGYTVAQLPATPSAFGGTSPIDGTITFDSGTNFAFTRNSGVPAGQQDFMAVAIHELGHLLGFSSAVDAATLTTTLPMTPLDLYRLAPGTGAVNFTTAPRVLVPGTSQVFYDGGQFNRASLGGGTFSYGDIPLSNAVGYQASHWANAGVLGTTVPIGIMDPVAYAMNIISQADVRAMELIGWDAVNRGAPGGWNGITLTQYSNDRNVALVNELETTYTGSNGDTNGVPTKAQQLGTLAPDLLNGDENRRLGFEIHGSVSFDNLGDDDVYSFTGTAGTPVWFDIMKTSPSLDTVVELIDSSGNVLARSNDSIAETANPNLLVGSASTTPFPLQASDVSGVNPDLYTFNNKDAGMRLLLPGTQGSTNTYYVRVRSNSGNLGNLHGGLTSGNYQLQIRLQEQVEVPGSTVQFADIRYATTGITAQGLPNSSPLTSTATNLTSGSPIVTNTTFDNAQDLGNLLASDQSMLSVSSALIGATSVNWFKFTLDYQDIQSIAGINGSGKSWATVFDVDFADGLARPDLTLSVFDSLGNLIYVSRASQVLDDQTGSVSTSAQYKLSSGSSGALDPFLGSVQLPEGETKTYYVAISSDAELPATLDQFYLANASNKLARLEPLNSVQRIVDDHIGTTGYVQSDGSVVPPATPAILPVADQMVPNPNAQFPNTVIQQLSLNVAPYTLDDLGIFVSQNSGAGRTLRITNAATGKTATIGGLTNTDDDSSQGFTDIVVRSDGVMMGAETQFGLNQPDNTAGALAAIDPTNGNTFLVGQDHIPNNPATPPTPPAGPPRDAVTAFSIDALAYNPYALAGSNLLLPSSAAVFEPYDLFYAVTGNLLTGGTQSFLYQADPTDGHANNSSATDDLHSIGPVGGSAQYSAIFKDSAGDVGLTTGMAFVHSTGIVLTAVAGANILDGQTFTITDASKTVKFEFDKNASTAQGNVAIAVTGTETADQIAQLLITAINNSSLSVTAVLQAASTTRIVVNNAFSGSPGNTQLTISGLANPDALYGVSNTGKLYTINTFRDFTIDPQDSTKVTTTNPTKGLVNTVVASFGGSYQWAGLALGPQNLDLNGDGTGGDLASTLFAITSGGDIYAIDPASGTFRMDVFKDANGAPVDHISTGVVGATGLAFQPIDFNLWHPTKQDSIDPGHGTTIAPDHSRDVQFGGTPTPPLGHDYGNTSYYFGLEKFGGGYISYNQNTQFGIGTPNAQFGMQSTEAQVDITRNALRVGAGVNNGLAWAFSSANTKGQAQLQQNEMLGNNINAPGGARGSLITNSFSLAGASSNDAPTLYFNYLLEAASGSAHVYISNDNGASWQMVATSNPKLGADLPKYISATSNTGSGDPKQGIQLLFGATRDDAGVLDNTWRQARIDLSQFAGQTNLKIQFRIDSGTSNNNFKGFSIDDIVVGSSGRGEMVTYMPPAAGGTAVPASTDFFTVPQNPDPGAPTQVLVGSFQLNIRRGEEYAANLGGINPKIGIYQLFDASSRLNQSFSLLAPGASLLTLPSVDSILNNPNPANPFTFTLSSGANQLTFEFVAANADPTQNGVKTKDHVGIIVVQDETAEQLAYSVLQAINNPAYSATIKQPPPAVKSNIIATLDPSGQALYLDGATAVDTSGAPSMSYSPIVFDGDTFTISDGFRSRTFEFNTTGGVSAGNIAVAVNPTDGPIAVAYQIAGAVNSQFGKTYGVSATTAGAGEVNLFGALRVDQSGLTGLEVLAFYGRGDQNPVRSQGELILANNRITSVANYGIQVLPAIRGPQMQTASNLMVLNSQRLVPGVVISNNIIDSAGQAGIYFSGDSNLVNGVPAPNAVVSFGRIDNNTIYGGGSGIGIQVVNNSSPTLLNNILANLQTGISVDGTSATAVLGANLYQENGQNTVGTGLGSFSIVQTAGAPLFVNAAKHNFNLLEKSSTGVVNKAIDSSLNTLQDRTTMTAVDSPLGIGASPIIAPATDGTGKLRVDDPLISPPLSGLGSNVFIDRGALDRSDFVGPTAALLVPADNSATDQNPALNAAVYSGGALPNFQIQFSDGNGSGVDDSTVSSASFQVYKDNVLLVAGTDYSFSYDSTNHIARFTPLVGIWPTSHDYKIFVANSGASAVLDMSANALLANSTDPATLGKTVFFISLQQIDFGSAPAPYPTTLAQDGARHIISDGLYLGSSVTPSADGVPSPSADNGDPGAGVVFSSPLVPGTTATITVTVSQAGFLDGWVDFSGNGSWADSGDQVFASKALVAGANVLTFNVPTTNATSTYARFRVSSTGGLSYTGIAADGEVEDYQVAVQPPVAYNVVLVDATTKVPLPKDASGHYVALAGSTFQAQVYVTDVRNVGATGGVSAAYADLTRDLSFVTFVSGSLTINPSFPLNGSGTVTSGSVTDAGGTWNNAAPGSGVQELLFTVNGTISQATAPGTIVTLTPSASANANHTTQVFGVSGSVAATFNSVQVIVPVHAWQNPVNQFDVNSDKFINILDIVKLVAMRNLGLGGVSGVLPVTPVAPNIPPPYVDVNGDNLFNVLDIVAEITYLNTHGSGPISNASAGGAAIVAAPSAVPPAIDAGTAATASAVTSAATSAPSTVVAADSTTATASIADSSVVAVAPASDWTAAAVSQVAAGSASATAGVSPTAESDSAAGTAGALSVGADSGRSQLFAAHGDDTSLLDLESVRPALAAFASMPSSPVQGPRRRM